MHTSKNGIFYPSNLPKHAKYVCIFALAEVSVDKHGWFYHDVNWPNITYTVSFEN